MSLGCLVNMEDEASVSLLLVLVRGDSAPVAEKLGKMTFHLPLSFTYGGYSTCATCFFTERNLVQFQLKG